MNRLTIGIAIPCYKGHLDVLTNLLQSIEEQTRKPDHVVVSCSSAVATDIPISLKNYSFPLDIQCHSEKKNPAQNRNCAIKHLSTDIVTFIDADDIMHPQRLEIIEYCFRENPVSILLHSFELDPTLPFQRYNPPYSFDFNHLIVCPFGSTLHLDQTPFNILHIHNAQSSVLKHVVDHISFDESPQYVGKEDTLFTTDVIRMVSSKTAYCHYKLSKYVPSRTADLFTTM
jgi:hypothetical protein